MKTALGRCNLPQCYPRVHFWFLGIVTAYRKGHQFNHNKVTINVNRKKICHRNSSYETLVTSGSFRTVKQWSRRLKSEMPRRTHILITVTAPFLWFQTTDNDRMDEKAEPCLKQGLVSVVLLWEYLQTRTLLKVAYFGKIGKARYIVFISAHSEHNRIMQTLPIHFR